VIAGLVPAGLLLAITLAYGLGAVRMLGQDVLIQQANAVESLSNVDVLCLDKTGTLTTNHLTRTALKRLIYRKRRCRFAFGNFAASASARNRTTDAIALACSGQQRSPIAEVAFSSSRQWSALAFDQSPQSGTYVLGAPEALAKSIPLDAHVSDRITALTAVGLRVVLFATSPDWTSLDQATSPQLPPDLTALGLLCFSDQLRPEAYETLQGFKQAGLEVKLFRETIPDGCRPGKTSRVGRQPARHIGNRASQNGLGSGDSGRSNPYRIWAHHA